MHQGADDDPIVVSYHDTLLRRSDVQLLSEGEWINDNLLDFAYEYFEQLPASPRLVDKSVMLLRPGFVKLLTDADFFDTTQEVIPGIHSAQVVMLPINDNRSLSYSGGTHWSLLVFLHYDSAAGSNNSRADTVMRRSRFEEAPTVQQKNSYDCGVSVIAISQHLLQKLSTDTDLDQAGDSSLWHADSVQLTGIRQAVKDIIASVGGQL
ncbi:SUMO1 sentrin specific peptidase 8 [Sorochytrium milnesiophthora]